MDCLINESLALLRRAKVWRRRPDIGKVLSFHAEKLRFVGIIHFHDPKPIPQVEGLGRGCFVHMCSKLPQQ